MFRVGCGSAPTRSARESVQAAARMASAAWPGGVLGGAAAGRGGQQPAGRDGGVPGGVPVELAVIWWALSVERSYSSRNEHVDPSSARARCPVCVRCRIVAFAMSEPGGSAFW